MNKLILVISVLIFASCNNSNDQKMVDLTPSSPKQPTPTATQPEQQKTTTVPTSSNNTETGPLNPKHGEPGHRCDIPEGAPLNGPVNNPSTIPPTTAAPVFKTPSSQQPLTNTVKLNPAHGEPGHDCAIPVGQPLKN